MFVTQGVAQPPAVIENKRIERAVDEE